MPEIAYVNGRFLPLDQATIHVEDRGFQFADGVYEVIRTYRGKPFALDEHLARLDRSQAGIYLKPPLTTAQWRDLIAEALQRAGFAESVVYIQVTRGRAPRHRRMPADAQPTMVLTVRELPAPPARLLADGASVITVDDIRWARCDLKCVALLPGVLAYEQAHAAGADDALFVEADGSVSESTAGNLFVIQGDRVRTPPLGPKLLPGITREKFIATARAIGLPCDEAVVMKSDLVAATEMFLTSTTVEMVPVVRVDGQVVGSGRPGPLTKRLRNEFHRLFVG